MISFATLDELRGAAGRHLGWTDWIDITQERVNLFADATGDHQWIHVDVDRANAESPFGGPIAHGFLTLSLSNLFLPQLIEVPGASAGVNYGTGKVRFPSPVPGGLAVRGGAEITARRGHRRRRADHHRDHDPGGGPGQAGLRDRVASAAGWRRRRHSAGRCLPALVSASSRLALALGDAPSGAETRRSSTQ